MEFLKQLSRNDSSQAPIVQGLAGLISKQGGLSGLLKKFSEAGLGEKAQSWVSTSENQSVSGQEVQQALGGQDVERIAAEAGVSPDVASDQIASVLPTMVDQLTPQGSVPDQAEVEETLKPLAEVESVSPEPSAEVTASTETYTVQSGDSLSAIAERLYGDASAYTRIFDANRDKLSNPDMIQPGQELVIPR